MAKQEVITFKVEQELAKTIKSIKNSSEFIREAIKKALKHSCPICNGKGYLNHNELEHLAQFLQDHELSHCEHCNANIIKCGGSHA